MAGGGLGACVQFPQNKVVSSKYKRIKSTAIFSLSSHYLTTARNEGNSIKVNTETKFGTLLH